jgi:hypothetical protein
VTDAWATSKNVKEIARVPGRTQRSQVTHYYFEGSGLWTPLLSSESSKAWREAPLIV